MHEQPVLLVLDDEQQIAELIAELGRQAGFRSVVTTTTDAFVRALDDRAPDVVALDLQMPCADGVQMLRALADRRLDAAVVLITGMDQRTISAAEQYGRTRGLRMLESLQKPFAPEDLFARLHTATVATQPLDSADLKRAITEGQLLLHYQPTTKRFADGTWDVSSVEALLRWDHPVRGMLSPDAFLAIGENSNLIGEMTDYVLARGVEQLRVWRAQRLDIGLRVNLAARLIADLTFPDRLESLLQEHDVEPEWLTLEITETGMLEQHPDTIDILTRLRVKNMNLAIDDFGIGYSSLTQLFKMPFNEMKIDKSLVLRLPEEREAAIMVEALVQLAHKLSLTVCAEGVETEQALDFLGGIGCDGAQGFFISPPVPPRDVPLVLEHWSRRVTAPRPAVG